MSSSAVVRQDILQTYPDLFGTQTVEGRAVNVEALIGRLTGETRATLGHLLKARHAFQARVVRKEARYDFLDPGLTIGDPDGNQPSVADIRQGMIDGFFGRPTRAAWRIAPTVPIPDDVRTPGLEGTGPSIDVGMAMGALNSGASQWMWD